MHKTTNLILDIRLVETKNQNCLLWPQPEAISMSDRVVVLNARPGTVKDIHKIEFDIENRNPINCRENPKFSQYFNTLWKELGVDE